MNPAAASSPQAAAPPASSNVPGLSCDLYKLSNSTVSISFKIFGQRLGSFDAMKQEEIVHLLTAMASLAASAKAPTRQTWIDMYHDCAHRHGDEEVQDLNPVNKEDGDYP